MPFAICIFWGEVCFGTISSNAQDLLLLGLCSGITPGRAQGDYIWLQGSNLGHLHASNCLDHCTISLGLSVSSLKKGLLSSSLPLLDRVVGVCC